MARIDKRYSRTDFGVWMPTFTVKETKTEHIKRACYVEDLSFNVAPITTTVSHGMSSSAVTSRAAAVISIVMKQLPSTYIV
jgi:hypothetical protein